jgi:hypothetical protein
MRTEIYVGLHTLSTAPPCPSQILTKIGIVRQILVKFKYQILREFGQWLWNCFICTDGSAAI